MIDPPPSRARLLRFGAIELDPRAGELRKHGVRLRLGEQPFKILLLLLDRPGEIVTREDIRQRLWPNNTIVEFDHSINAAIRRLRAALGETADKFHHIETMGSRGYRFVGEVVVCDSPLNAVGPEAAGRDHGAPDEPAMEDRPTALFGLTGQIVSHYRLIEELGSGGMGVVYRAEDLRLGREVALKFLPDEVAADPVAKQRFERETRVASALNHPNICTIYGVEEAGGQLFLAMELIEGVTLEARLAQGAMPRAQALAAGVQVCAALDAAHRRGLVHRDLKPANVMLTKSGAKVLDFGLAKAEMPPEHAREAQVEKEAAVTEAGTLLGTLQYMSPEQVRGEEADARSDIFSFGLVLYEALTGRRAFPAETRAELIASVLQKDPEWKHLPHGLERTVRKCLAKDPDTRWQSAADLRDELEWAGRERSWTRRRKAAAIGAASVALFFAGIVAADRPGADFSHVRFTPLAMEPGYNMFPVWSPDGRSFAYMHNGRLLIRTVDSPVETRVATSALSILFSKDGKRLYYTHETSPYLGRKLWSVPVTGGDAQPMEAEDLGGRYLFDGVTLSPDGKAIIGLKSERDGAGYSLVSSSPPGAPWQALPCPSFHQSSDNGHLRFSPDGNQLLIGLAAQMWLLDWPAARARPPRQILAGIRGGGADWLPDSRHLLLQVNAGGENRSEGLFVADTRTNALYPLMLGQGPAPKISGGPEGKFLAAIADPDQHDIVEIPLDGSPLRPLMTSKRDESYSEWSHSGDRLVYVDTWSGRGEIWIWTPAEDLRRLLVSKGLVPGATVLKEPVFSPDDRRIAFATAQGGIWVIPAPGGTAVPVSGSGDAMSMPTWSPDGEWLAYRVNHKGKMYLEKVRLDDPERPIRIAETVQGVRAAWSPDGKWITLAAAEGVDLISPDGKLRKHVHGAVSSWTSIGWSRDGKTLYLAVTLGYEPILVPSTVYAIDATSGQERIIGHYTGVWFGGGPGWNLSPSPDGKTLAVTLAKPYNYIWLIEGIAAPQGLWGRLHSRLFPQLSK